MNAQRAALTKVIPAWSFDKRRAFAERASPSGAPKTAVLTPAMSAHSNQPGRSYWPPTPEGTVQPVKDFSSGIGKGTGNVVSSHQVSRGRRPSLPEHDEMPVGRVMTSHCGADIRSSSSLCTKITSSPNPSSSDSCSHPHRHTWTYPSHPHGRVSCPGIQTRACHYPRTSCADQESCLPHPAVQRRCSYPCQTPNPSA